MQENLEPNVYSMIMLLFRLNEQQPLHEYVSELQNFLVSQFPTNFIQVSCINSRNQLIFSVDSALITPLKQQIQNENSTLVKQYGIRKLVSLSQIEYPFHTEKMTNIAALFKDYLKYTVKDYMVQNTPHFVISNVSGELVRFFSFIKVLL